METKLLVTWNKPRKFEIFESSIGHYRNKQRSSADGRALLTIISEAVGRGDNQRFTTDPNCLFILYHALK